MEASGVTGKTLDIDEKVEMYLMIYSAAIRYSGVSHADLEQLLISTTLANSVIKYI